MSDDARRFLELQREQWRRQCRQSFIAFCTEALSLRGEVPALHHRLIASELEAVARGKRKRLMILAPPGSAKTTYTSRLLPAWYFAFRPRSSIIAVSHTQELSETNSGFVQRTVRDSGDTLDYSLLNDAKGRWNTSNHCSYLAGSVGSAILGFRANVAIIDDPIKSKQEAELGDQPGTHLAMVHQRSVDPSDARWCHHPDRHAVSRRRSDGPSAPDPGR